MQSWFNIYLKRTILLIASLSLAITAITQGTILPYRRSSPPIRHYSNFGSALDYLERGNFYAEQGEHKKAIANYNQAIEMTPHYADAYFNRGNSYAQQQKYDLAIADYKQSN